VRTKVVRTSFFVSEHGRDRHRDVSHVGVGSMGIVKADASDCDRASASSDLLSTISHCPLYITVYMYIQCHTVEDECHSIS
jgi:hypothetical protein